MEFPEVSLPGHQEEHSDLGARSCNRGYYSLYLGNNNNNNNNNKGYIKTEGLGYLGFNKSAKLFNEQSYFIIYILCFKHGNNTSCFRQREKEGTADTSVIRTDCLLLFWF